MAKTPISILQELMVQNKASLPDYCIEHCKDENGFPFKSTVKVGSIKAVGYAFTKQEAKQNSAKEALDVLGYNLKVLQKSILPMVIDNNIKKLNSSINYVGKLNELASTHRQSYPTYHDHPIPNSLGMFLCTCSFLQYVSQGYGLKKKDAKQHAAQEMLNMLKDGNVSLVTLELQNLNIEKEANLDNLAQEIKKKYDKLTTHVDTSNPVSESFLFIPDMKKNVTTFEDFRKELKKLGYMCSIDTFQKDPYIMMMKIRETNATIMGKGDTKEQALKDLFDNVSMMFNYGFSLKPAY